MTSENVESWKVKTKPLSIFEAGISCLLPSWKTPRNRLIVKFRRWKLHLREISPHARPGRQTKILYKEEMSRIQGGEDREHWQSFSVGTRSCWVQVDITLSLTRTVNHVEIKLAFAVHLVAKLHILFLFLCLWLRSLRGKQFAFTSLKFVW